jgi:hypothetical protein
VFLIDASAAMLQPARSLPGGEPRSYLDVAINCAENVMRSRIMCAPSDKQGRGFYSFPFPLNVSTFCGIRLGAGFPPVY